MALSRQMFRFSKRLGIDGLKLSPPELRKVDRPKQHLHQRLQQLADAKRGDMILPIFKQLMERKVKLDPRDLSVGISACARAIRWEEASILFSSMHLGKVYPNVFIYNATISSYDKSAHWQFALYLFQEMSFKQIFPSVVTYNSMISACGKGGEWQRALQFFHSILDRKLSPTVVSYTAAICALEKSHWQGALSLFSTMAGRNISPDVITCNALISSCEKGNQWQMALNFFQHICQLQLQPNLVSYNAIICDKTWQQSLQILQNMSEAKLHPDFVTYSSIIGSLSKSGLWQLALYFLQRSVSLSLPDVISYNVSIHCCAAASEWQQALEVVQSMVSNKVSPTVVSSTTIINSLPASKWPVALHLWQKIQGDGLEPDSIAWSIMLDFLCGSQIGLAQAFFESALKAKMLEDLVSSGHEILDLHGYSVGASQLAVCWWLQMTVAPYLQERWIQNDPKSTSKFYQITLVTGFGSLKIQSVLVQMLKGMGIETQIHPTNPGRILASLRPADLPLLLRCFTLPKPKYPKNGCSGCSECVSILW